MWFDNAIRWFQQHRAPLGGITGFLAGVLLILDKFYDFKILDAAIAIVGFTASYLVGAGATHSDQYHKEKEEYLRGFDRRQRQEPKRRPANGPQSIELPPRIDNGYDE